LRSGKDLEKEFARYARKRTRQLKSTFKEVVDKLDSRALHDFRQATRQLQTIVDAHRIHRPSRKAEKIRQRLRRSRHALGEWRDCDVMLKEIKKAQRKARARDEGRCWSQVADRVAKQRRRTMRKFLAKYKSLRIGATAAGVKALVKKKIRSDTMMDDLRLLLQRSWEKWNVAIDDFVGDVTAAKLHAVRIKAKTVRYAVELSQRFYPDNHLDSASEWLEDIQDRIGAWHDEYMLGQYALETFSSGRASREPAAIKVIRGIKETEIAMAESSRNFILSIRKTKDYQQLRRLLSASVYAMANGSGPSERTSESIEGPIQ
jgi:CHAD domain-containing protein